MGDFRGSSRGFGDRPRRSFGGRDGGRDRGRSFGGGRDRGRGFGGRDGGRREFHDVICDKCKKECKVPFKPSTDKPVLCSDCFEKKGGSSRGGSGVSKEQFDQVNKKLDKILKVLQELEIAPSEEEEKGEEAEETAEEAVLEEQEEQDSE